MASVNKVILIGNLGRDPETRYLPSGVAVTSISVATTEKWKDKKSGEMQERTEWTRCSMFGKVAEVAGEYLKKGSPVYLEGKLHTNEYEKDGQKHYATEVRVDRMQLLGGRGGGGSKAEDYAAGSGASSRGGKKNGAGKKGGAFENMDDDIPF